MTQNKPIPMDHSHVSQVAELEKLCFSDPWSENAVRSELQNPLSHWLVFLEDTRVVAYVGSQTVLDETDIMNVAVHPEFRRRGLAGRLLLALEADLKQKGVYQISLEVRASNAPAIALYHGLGYVQVGRRPNYYHKPKEDALILRKEWAL